MGSILTLQITRYHDSLDLFWEPGISIFGKNLYESDSDSDELPIRH